ncbi:MAG: class I SAM-dependent methyltransferase [Paracoccaceae bacterium]
MIGTRLAVAIEAGLVLPESNIVFHPNAESDLNAVPNARVVQPFRPDHDHFQNMGYPTSPEEDGSADGAIVCVPRAKKEAYNLIARAAQSTSGILVVDGQKGDGIDSVLKAVRARVNVAGVISKAHGKLFWFSVGPDAVFDDWLVGPALTDGGFWTAPGVFSADGVDEGSALLADALPENLKGHVLDFGAGWGFLSAHVLVREAVESLHLVEAHHLALQCAEHNITDPRVRFHWADATRWETPVLMDAVVMNPPFHRGKAGDPGLGQAFIQSAARNMKPTGKLWMVANRHLPYEDTIASLFAKVIDLGGNQRFKLICAERPKRRR